MIINTKKVVIKFVLLLMLLQAIVGCGSSEDKKLTQYIKTVKSKPPRPIEPIPEFKQLEKFQYPEDAIRRNPFRPVAIAEQDDVSAPDTTREKQVLEAFPLDALKFVGMLGFGNTTWGLIKQPNGMVSRVKPGDYMGKNYGQIIRITDDKISIEETIKVGDKWEKRLENIKLTTPN